MIFSHYSPFLSSARILIGSLLEFSEFRFIVSARVCRLPRLEATNFCITPHFCNIPETRFACLHSRALSFRERKTAMMRRIGGFGDTTMFILWVKSCLLHPALLAKVRQR
jgi:hypothetical protein